MTTRWFSLRRRLLGFILGGVTAIWLATTFLSYMDAHHEVDELFDAQLVESAQTLLALAGPNGTTTVEDLGEVAHKYQRRLRFQIWRSDNTLLLRSNNAPTVSLTTVPGFAETLGDDGHWRHYSQWNEGRTLQVQVSENHQLRDELIAHIVVRLLWPALIGLPLIGFWVWAATRRSLSPLDEAAAQIAARAPEQLLPVLPTAAPEEIRPLVAALNDLLHRVDVTITSERRFTADAAHELRTPLAALAAQLQVALQARDEVERQSSLRQLQSGLTRAAHLVDQMLQLARLDPESGLPNPQPVSLPQLAESVCADLGSFILEKNLDFDLLADGEINVTGQEEWLRVLMRNLVDNAIRYTPSGGQLRIFIGRSPNGPFFRIEDSGPGIPASQREAALRRFHRLNQGQQPGSGLGLAIVSRIAELHGAQLQLADNPARHGLAISVTWPDAH